MNKRHITYVEHLAGSYEDGLQVCKLCGLVLTDYTGSVMIKKDEIMGDPLPTWKEGQLLYIYGNMTIIQRPDINYGEYDPYIRSIKKCCDV